jgi:monoamine oxidase
MNTFKKNTTNPFLKTLQKAFYFATESKKPGSAPFAELLEKHKEQSAFQRREFLNTVITTGAVVGMSGIISACKKVDSLVPDYNFQNSGTNNQSNYKKGAQQPRIAILGAGIAGLTCAYQLKKQGYTSTVYEASSRVGGRILTKNNFVAQGIYTECGGEFIDTGHKHMLKLATEFGLPLIDTQIASESALAHDSFYIDGVYYNETAVMNAFAPYANQIAADISSLPNSFGFNSYNQTVLNFDQMSINDYFNLIGIPTSSFLRKGLDVAYNTEYGREINEQTAINFLFLFSINPGNNKFQIFGASDERYKIDGGNQKIIDALYSDVQTQVQLNNSLQKITKNSSDVYTLFFANGTSIKADIVILTIPFSILKNIDLSNLALPSWKTNAIQNLGYGTNSKLIMGFTNRTWRSYGQSGYVFTSGNLQNPSLYLQTGWDSSQLQNSSNASFTVFQGGNLGNSLSLNQTGTFLSQLDNMWNGTLATYNGNSKLIHWPTHQYSLGSYACWKVGQVTTIKDAEIMPVGNLYFAGEHTSGNNQGYMEGGAETGKKVANNIVKFIQTGSV